MVVKGFVGCLAALVIAGCASTPYVPEIPSDVAKAVEDYNQLPDNKVFVLAVDPGGDYAYAYADSKATLKEAAKEATIECDQARAKYNVVSTPVIYAVNNKVVYEDMIEKMNK